MQKWPGMRSSGGTVTGYRGTKAATTAFCGPMTDARSLLRGRNFCFPGIAPGLVKGFLNSYLILGGIFLEMGSSLQHRTLALEVNASAGPDQDWALSYQPQAWERMQGETRSKASRAVYK